MAALSSVFKILPIFFFLFSQSTPSQHGVLSKLYQKAVNEHRPLVLVLDSENGLIRDTVGKRPRKPQQHNRLPTAPSSLLGSNGNKEVSMLKALIKKITALSQHSHGPSVHSEKKTVLRTQEQMVGPLLKTLLRVSNDMNCKARDECEENGETKNDCEEKFECDEKKEDKQGDCAVEDIDECDTGDLQSTKGYTLEPEDNTCTRC